MITLVLEVLAVWVGAAFALAVAWIGYLETLNWRASRRAARRLQVDLTGAKPRGRG